MAVVISTVNWAFIYQTLDGANISEQSIATGALASGDNTVAFPASIVQLPLIVIPATSPDDTTILTKSWSKAAAATAWAVGTAYSLGDAVTYQGVQYVSIQAGTGHIPSTSPTFWTAVSLYQAVINASGTTADGASLFVKVPAD